MISLVPKIGSKGHLQWYVQSSDETALLDAETGQLMRHVKNDGQVSEVFEAVVEALAEWYKTDLAEFDGLNVAKVKTELTRTR